MEKRKPLDVKIVFDLMNKNNQPSAKIIIGGLDISSVVAKLNLTMSGGNMPIIELNLVPEKLDVSGKVKSFKTLKLLEDIDGE